MELMIIVGVAAVAGFIYMEMNRRHYAKHPEK